MQYVAEEKLRKMEERKNQQQNWNEDKSHLV